MDDVERGSVVDTAYICRFLNGQNSGLRDVLKPEIDIKWQLTLLDTDVIVNANAMPT